MHPDVRRHVDFLRQNVERAAQGEPPAQLMQTLDRLVLRLEGRSTAMVFGMVVNDALAPAIGEVLLPELRKRLAALSSGFVQDLERLAAERNVPEGSRLARTLPDGLLTSLLAHRTPLVRQVAAEALSGRDAARSLVECLRREQDPGVIGAVATSLAASAGMEGVPVLEARLLDVTHGDARAAVVRALARLQPLRATEWLRSLQPRDVVAVLDTMSERINPFSPDELAAMRACLDHLSLEVRVAACNALRADATALLPQLRVQLNENVPLVLRSSALEALARLGRRQPSQALRTLLALAAQPAEPLQARALELVEAFAGLSLDDAEVKLLVDGLPALPEGSRAAAAVDGLRARRVAPVVGPWLEGAEAFEAVIDAAPEDPKPWLVYADWLQTRGHPLGEVIAVAHAGSPVLPVVKEHASALLGELPSVVPLEQFLEGCEWFMGLLRHARLDVAELHGAALEVMLGHLLRAPLARFLRSLSLSQGTVAYDNDYQAALDVLRRAPTAARLRALKLGDFDEDAAMMSDASWGDVSKVWTFTGLERLHLRGARGELGEVTAPGLRELIIETGGLSQATFDAVLDGELGGLEKLELWFGDANYGAECGPADVEPLLDGSRFPRLTALGLCNAEFTDELIEPLAKSKLLPRLKRLDLSRGTLTSRGAAELRRRARAFAHLEQLDLRQNLLEEDEDFEGLPVDAGDQREAYDGDRYVAVGE